MKRCPQCEFIYEDDQNTCDMDGSHLAFDSQFLPNLQALQEIGPVVTTKRNWKGHSVPAFASLILVVVLFLVYFVTIRSFNQPILQGPGSSGSQSSTGSKSSLDAGNTPLQPPESTSNPNTPATVDSQIETASNGDAGRANESVKKKSSSKADNGPARPSRTLSSSSPNEKKEPSKVGSILKKTGQLLKKPFKL